ncbi:hypothetical protein ACSFA8_19740 [Variovorax sp. RT4R15]|uniref:hypothetical protein n=1 Tax=Variovorax sp. RT4R15 TaxID=3443737 RepID=UPI003F44DF15
MEIELDRLVDALPGPIWTARFDETVDFLNQRRRANTGIYFGEAKGHGRTVAIHPDVPGATFSFSVPVQPDDAARADAPA